MSTHADRLAEQRKVKLDEIKQQVKAGSLKIRQMTAKERESFPPCRARNAAAERAGGDLSRCARTFERAVPGHLLSSMVP